MAEADSGASEVKEFVRMRGEVTHGFGRGSKQLGIPTANFPEQVVEGLPESMTQGIYYGWAKVSSDGVVRKAVMSVGWNPFYNNTKRSAEVHILHKYDEDFYGQDMRMIVLGHIRPEKNFTSLEALIEAIHEDIRQTEAALERPEMQAFKSHPYFDEP